MLEKNKKLSSLDTLFLGKEKEYFIDNFATLVSSGIGVLTALESVKLEIHSKRLKKVVDAMKDDIEEGTPIWLAFEKSGILPKNVIALVKIGEQTGRLSENLKIIAIQQKKDRSFRSKIRSGMMYPGFVLGLTLVVGLVVAWFIIPRLANVFAGLHIDLPLITRVLIATGAFLGQYGYIAVPSFLLIVAVSAYFIFTFSKTKFIGEAIILKTPGISELVIEVELARFGFVLGTLLKAGLPVDEAIGSLADVTEIRAYKRLYQYLLTSIQEGNSFEKSFSRYPNIRRLIPISVEQLVSAGEQSGNLADVLIKIGESYEDKTDISAKNLTIILEPVLLVIVAGGVFSVALSVILPIYSLIGGLGSGGTDNTPPPAPQVLQVETPLVIATSTIENISVKAVTKLEILPTGLGYLRVRSGPSTGDPEVSRVLPGETYEYIEKLTDWYKILLPDDKTGFVSKKYVKEI